MASLKMLSFYPSRECRPLKKSKLGPPDVYGQDVRQREDELTESNLKCGFKYCVSSLDAKDESSSALQDVVSGISSGDLQLSLQGMMVVKHKQEIYSRESLLKKRPATSKEVFQSIKPTVSDNKVSAFFQDLSGAASLNTIIQKKVLVTIRKKDVFEHLWNYMVPLDRACWFIKMNNAHLLTLEKRGRKSNDPSSEWTSTLWEFVSSKFKCQQGPLEPGENKDSPQQPQSSNAPAITASSAEQLQYLVQLCYKMYQDGLLDRHAFLKSLVDSLEQKKTNELLLSYLPLLLLFVEELLCSQFLSRTLAEFCILRIRQLHDAETQEEELRRKAGEGVPPRSEANLVSYSLMLKLSAVLHCIILDCPLALIWLPTETRSSFPLDKLPVDVTSLPILPQADSVHTQDQIYRELPQRVQELRSRRHAAEMKWTSVGIQASSMGAAVRELVDILDNLDSFRFTDVTCKNRLLDLYKKVFHSPDTLQSLSIRDETIILLLCQWAVAPDQVGRHRPLLVSGLIWARQMEWLGQSVESLQNDYGEFDEEMVELGSAAGGGEGRDRFPFQHVLIRFLDRNESMPASKQTPPKDGGFLLICILFSELIQRDVFSFEQYMRFLVARGDLQNTNANPLFVQKLHHNIEPPISPPPGDLPDSSLPRDEESTCSLSSQSSSQPTDSDGSLLHIKEHAHLTRSNSPKPKPPGPHSKSSAGLDEEARRPNTYHYVMHFPAPDSRLKLEAQRASLLYGVGARREFCLKVLDSAKEEVIKVANSLKSESQSGCKMALKQFRALPICTQQEVAAACASKNIKNLSLTRLLFIVELLDVSGSISRLIEFLFDVIVNMQEEESMKDAHPNIESPPTRRKPLHLTLRIPVVSLLQAYLPSLLASAYHTSLIFERLTFVFEKVKSSDHPLRSDQMRVFLFLNQLYQSCFYLMEAHKDTFGPFQKSLEHTTHSNYHLSSTDLRREGTFRQELQLQHPADIPGTVATLCKLVANSVGFPPFSLICELYSKACSAPSVPAICDLAHIYADVCSEFPALNNEFMGAIRAICAPSLKNGFKELHSYILPSDKSFHYKLVIFIAFVVVHNPLLLSNLVDSVMIAACQYHRNPDPSEHLSSALEVTFHLILTILTEEGKLQSDALTPQRHSSTSTEEWQPTKRLPLYVKRFLYVQNQQLPLSSISELLKQMLLLIEYLGADKKIGSSSNYIHKKFGKCLEAVAGQSWVREKCQCEVEQLALALTEKEKDVQFPGTLPGIGEPKLKQSQAKLLIDYICYPGKSPTTSKDDKAHVMKILESLSLWNLRSSLIELFVNLQLTPQQQLTRLTETISNIAFQVFSQKQQEGLTKQDSEEIDLYCLSPAWLVAPLISRLPSNVHGRILKMAGEQIKVEWWTLQSADAKDGSSSSGKQQSFLELVLACLHSGSQEELLDPLSKQLRSFLKAPAEEKHPSDPKLRAHLNASLKVRLGLVGSLLDIARQNACYDWCSLLMQLLCSGAVDPDHTGTTELYTTTLDMLCILYRSLSLVCESNSAKDLTREPRKNQSSLIDQLKQELNNSSLTQSKCFHDLSQLIGIPRPGFHMKLFSRYNKNGFNPDDMSEYNLPGWDVLEGFPHNNNLSLTHYLKFIRHEPRPLKYEEQYRLCMLHTHTNKHYTPYSVMLPEAPDNINTPGQSSLAGQDNDVITINTPTESPTTKRQKRVSNSSLKDPKRQDSITLMDVTRQLKTTSPSLEAMGMPPSMHQSQPMYHSSRVTIPPGQSSMHSHASYPTLHPSEQITRKIPNSAIDVQKYYNDYRYQNIVQQQQQHHQQQQQQRQTPMINLTGPESSRLGGVHSKPYPMEGYGTQTVSSAINQYGQQGLQQRSAQRNRAYYTLQQARYRTPVRQVSTATARYAEAPSMSRQVPAQEGSMGQYTTSGNMQGMYQQPQYEQPTYQQQSTVSQNFQMSGGRQPHLIRSQGQMVSRHLTNNPSILPNNMTIP